MSWSISIYEDALSIDDFAAAARAKFNERAASHDPPLSDEAREQLEAALVCAKVIALSGAAGPGPYKGSLSGHANPGHQPAPGWANDCVNVSLMDARLLVKIADPED